jgi:hypothetical protein
MSQAVCTFILNELLDFDFLVLIQGKHMTKEDSGNYKFHNERNGPPSRSIGSPIKMQLVRLNSVVVLNGKRNAISGFGG